ncbi:MAG: glycosyltransferase family 2 protein [Cellvibrionaceae bacterium]
MPSDTSPLVTVIIPTFNRKQQCLRAVQSALQQVSHTPEIIVIDDGSTDNTEAHLSHLKDRILYIYQDNQGASAARNLGLEHAKGEYIAFLDADDYFTDHHLKNSLDLLCNTDIDFVFSNTIRGENPEKQERSFLDGKNLPGLGMYQKDIPGGILSEDTWLHIIEGNIIPPSTSVMRRNFIGNHRFSESYTVANDTEFFSRVLKKQKIAFINKIGAFCEVTDDNLTSKIYNLKRHKLKLRLIEYHYKQTSNLDERKKLKQLKRYFLHQTSSHYWNNKQKIKALILRCKSKLIRT